VCYLQPLEKSMLFRVTQSAKFYVVQAGERVLELAYGKSYVVSSSNNGIFNYVAQAFERVLATLMGKCVWFKYTIVIIIYVAQPVLRLLATIWK